MLTNCLEVFVLGTNSTFWHLMVGQQACKTSHKMDSGIGQTLGSFDLKHHYIHHTNDHRQYCHVGDTAERCRLGLFQDLDFAGDLDDSKLASGESYVFSEIEHVFPSVGCARSKRQCLTILQNQKWFHRNHFICCWFARGSLFWSGNWCWSIALFFKSTSTGSLLRDKDRRKNTNTKPKKHPNRDDLESVNVDHCTANAKPSHFGALLYTFWEQEEVITMIIIKVRSPTMRHVSRTHRVAHHWSLTESNWTPQCESHTLIPKTNSQTLMKCNFTCDGVESSSPYVQHHAQFDVL